MSDDAYRPMMSVEYAATLRRWHEAASVELHSQGEHEVSYCLPAPEQPGYLVHSLAPLPSDVSTRVWAPGEGLPGQVLRAGQPVVVEDLAMTDGRGTLEGPLLQGGLRAALGVPVRRGVEAAGALLFASRSPAAYHADDIQIAAIIAAGLGSALESSRAYQALADERSTPQPSPDRRLPSPAARHAARAPRLAGPGRIVGGSSIAFAQDGS
jgi:GAF domain-containing protein